MPTRVLQIETKNNWFSFVVDACNIIYNRNCNLSCEIFRNTNRVFFKCCNDTISIEYYSQNVEELFFFFKLYIEALPYLRSVIINIPIDASDLD